MNNIKIASENYNSFLEKISMRVPRANFENALASLPKGSKLPDLKKVLGIPESEGITTFGIVSKRKPSLPLVAKDESNKLPLLSRWIDPKTRHEDALARYRANLQATGKRMAEQLFSPEAKAARAARNAKFDKA